GKVDRNALAELNISNAGAGENYVSPRNETERVLVQIWSEILAVEKETISTNSNFFQLGGHSLNATIMTVRIQQKLAAAVPLSKIFRSPTIKELATFVDGAGKSAVRPVEAVETREYYPLSFNQRRMYILFKMQPESSAYNLPGHVDLEHDVERADAVKTLERLLARHESLRTVFKPVYDLPRQFIVQRLENPLEYFDVSSLQEVEKQRLLNGIYKKIASEPFELSEPPLLRVGLVKIEAGYYRLMFCLHHIIADGWSMEILKKEFIRIYDSIRSGREV
ncbi:MAG: hypothetical protein GY757_23785, partial [bacterium]|nr:hypothetical protein [bacterium]